MKEEPQLQLFLLLESDHVSDYAIRRAVELARHLGAELRAQLVQNPDAERAARLPLTRRIGLESGRPGSFSTRDVEIQLRRAAAELEALLLREAATHGVVYHLELSAAGRDAAGGRWILLGHPASLRRQTLPVTRQDLVILLKKPAPPAPAPVTAIVCLAEPSQALLERAAEAAGQCALQDPLIVFTRKPLQCQREAPPSSRLQEFRPLPRNPFSASRLLAWLERHGASAALVILPKQPQNEIDDWVLRLAEMSEIPLVFLRENDA